MPISSTRIYVYIGNSLVFYIKLYVSIVLLKLEERALVAVNLWGNHHIRV